MKAKIEWLTQEQGGRKTGIPFGNKYAPVVKIINDVSCSDNLAWSLIINNLEQIANYVTIAEINYLSEIAPNNLIKDARFEMFEGNKLVAKGIVI